MQQNRNGIKEGLTEAMKMFSAQAASLSIPDKHTYLRKL